MVSYFRFACSKIFSFRSQHSRSIHTANPDPETRQILIWSVSLPQKIMRPTSALFRTLNQRKTERVKLLIHVKYFQLDLVFSLQPYHSSDILSSFTRKPASCLDPTSWSMLCCDLCCTKWHARIQLVFEYANRVHK